MVARNPFARWLFGAAIVLAAACAAWPGAAETTLERIKEENKVRVGVANERPYGYVDENGRLTGEAPEIARKIFADIDPEIELEPVVVNFGELIPELNAGNIDMIAAGMYVTPDRCEQVAFTAPTYRIGEAFAVKKGNPKGLRNFETVAANHQAKVGIMAGTVEYNYAYEAGIPGDRALLYADYDAALRALQRGEVDAVAMTALTVRTLLEQRNLSEMESTPQFYPEANGGKKVGYGAFAVRHADSDLLEAFNKRLKAFVDTPEHWSTVEPFGFDKDMAPDKTTAALCAGD
ncbi:ectoine/hydroxyectoine ABC transporter substrate-binding protein EhuB [Ferruginivarius sediminum]|uniref:Ectoine/hydroxyectoine ABC transporter substrate-binding protein EhuB n=1 Tax=Ferruginivarius sediminum TaxID=2661937 RepID=A0A369T658_9PROT|nr:ectoine/hydroxyectoine ABC transporter substrate-binding protein EhuB [Ferruginivarius sediminum]RDD60382.1 ectoine/hydroxyectoine ABC transporter substrate-binding protein EhuB [Ferruginivarius sediminum]